MSCIRCGESNTPPGGRICYTCLSDWSKMRTEAFTALENKYGKLSPSNHPTFKSEIKRLEKIWRKDKKKFQEEIEFMA